MDFSNKLLQQLLGGFPASQQQGPAAPGRRPGMVRGMNFQQGQQRLSPGRPVVDLPWTKQREGGRSAMGHLGSGGQAPAAMAAMGQMGGLGQLMGMATRNKMAQNQMMRGALMPQGSAVLQHQSSADPSSWAGAQYAGLVNQFRQYQLPPGAAAYQRRMAREMFGSEKAAAAPGMAGSAKDPNNPGMVMGLNGTMLPWMGYSGYLRVNQKQNEVVSPAGYGVICKDGVVRIEIGKGKWTTLKADPPNRTRTRTETKTETRTKETLERVLPRDPVVKESDGDIWRYQGTGSFILPDGTKVTVQEKGKGKGLHIFQVDVYNGSKHVSIQSRLVRSTWETFKTEKKKPKVGNWRTTSSRTSTRRTSRRREVWRRDQEAREIRTDFVEHQRAVQKFETKLSGVGTDAVEHDAKTDDGFEFRMAGDGQSWAHKNKEVMSGAGKGKDDKTKAFKLGDDISHI